ncbi:MAG TPA: CheR family methyltransferase [Candidatus Eisenbacteria bacterium]|nr:CheR family methyltransferase [Candidatus Eisenbacteria bacterium]
MSPTEVNADFEALLLYLQQSRGFDFTGYKRSTLMRRVLKRMGQVGIGDFADYLDYLQVHPDEFAQLFNTILINVTSFFRDPDAWEFLAREVLPRIIASKPGDDPIRCWCAGTASGEEAYSLAIMLTEALGVEQFRRRVKIYATDVDEEALSQARLAGHTAREIESVPPEFVERYFELVGTRHTFRTDLRRSLIFGRHDLVQDAPISRLDLLVCRNILMYFTAETQARILARLHYALNDGGFLFLGKAEMLLTHTNLFTPVDLRHRVFTKVPKVTLRDRLMVVSQAGSPEASQQLGRQIRMLELVNDAMPAAQVVVDAAGHVALVNERARTWFRLNARDVGRPLQDLEVSYRPLELRSLLDQAYGDRRQVSVLNVERRTGDAEVQYLDLFVTPLLENDRGVLGASIIFTDVTHFHRLQEELERSRQELETAYEELQSTNEELETTNEELQSTVEELETTNEELQSSNEELETMNEELESTTSELQAINGELRQRTEEVEEVNAFMESVLGGLQLGVVVVDPDLRVEMWCGRSEDLWGLRAAEVHEQPLMALDIGLPLGAVRSLVRSVLAGEGETREAVVDATNRRGRPIRCRLVASPGLVPGADRPNVVLLMEELKKT